MIYYLLLLVAILLETMKNVLSNRFSKEVLVNETDIYKFNFLMYSGSVAVLFCFPDYRWSLFTLITGGLFALSIWINQYFYLKALKTGAVSFVTFIQGMGLLVPLIYGVFVWNETIKWYQILLLAVLIAGMGLSLDLKKGEGKNSWIFYSFGAMLGLGAIGVLQSTHQMSEYKSEVVSFIRFAFLFTVLINGAGWKIREKKEPSTYKIGKSVLKMSILSGVAMGLVHVISLYIAGILPKIIFFPVANGGLIFTTLIFSQLFLKEKCTPKQWVGIVAGTVALSLIGL